MKDFDKDFFDGLIKDSYKYYAHCVENGGECRHELLSEHSALTYSYARILLCSSLKRMCKIKDDVARNRLCYETWTNLNTKFPDWKKNKLLKSNNGKNLYMRTVNNKTFKFYCNLFKKL